MVFASAAESGEREANGILPLRAKGPAAYAWQGHRFGVMVDNAEAHVTRTIA